MQLNYCRNFRLLPSECRKIRTRTRYHINQKNSSVCKKRLDPGGSQKLNTELVFRIVAITQNTIENMLKNFIFFFFFSNAFCNSLLASRVLVMLIFFMQPIKLFFMYLL